MTKDQTAVSAYVIGITITISIIFWIVLIEFIISI